MAAYAAFKHVELYNVGKTKKREIVKYIVLKQTKTISTSTMRTIFHSRTLLLIEYRYGIPILRNFPEGILLEALRR
uniref:Uncharacterized protein n=1 Tax=Glossina morsitans morsitans TaxID=37546 RepID=A0A1B0FA92_GLOMM